MSIHLFSLRMAECELNLARYFDALPKVGNSWECNIPVRALEGGSLPVPVLMLMPGDVDSSKTVPAQKPKAIS